MGSSVGCRGGDDGVVRGEEEEEMSGWLMEQGKQGNEGKWKTVNVLFV